MPATKFDEDYFDFSEIAFLQHFQHFQMVTLHVHVFRVVKINRVFTHGPQHFGSGQIDRYNRLFLARPFKTVALFHTFSYLASQFLL